MKSFIVKKLKDSEPGIAKALLGVTQGIAEVISTPSLSWVSNKASRQIDLNEASIIQYLAWHQKLRSFGVYVNCTFANDQRYPTVSFILEDEENREDYEAIGGLRQIELYLPELELDVLIAVFSRVCLEFGAFYGHENDYQLFGMFGRSRGPYKFNFRYIPDGIWWINFWDAVQVEIVGRERILNAPWAKVVHLPNGSLVLVSTEELPDPENQNHLERLSQIYECLHLKELKRQYRRIK